METGVIASAFVLLLGLEWRYRLRYLRLGAVVFAIAVLALYQPVYGAAERNAYLTPPAQRITRVPQGVEGDALLSDYQSGVLTMSRTVGYAVRVNSGIRTVAVGALV